MKEVHNFKHKDYTVSLIGISKMDWIYAKHNETKEQAFEKMQKNKYDILPIQEADGSYKRYFKTKEWGKYEINDIEEYKIKPEDRIHFLSKIEDTVKAFVETDRNFFFLENEKEIVGLIYLGNLNSKHVYIYLYNLIAQLELALGKLIYNSGIDDNELISVFKENNRAVKSLTRYRREDKRSLGHKFLDYVYLGDMSWIIKEKELYKKIKIDHEEFDSSIKNIDRLRNIVAHPTSSLIKEKNSINNLSQAITKLEIILEKINRNIFL